MGPQKKKKKDHLESFNPVKSAEQILLKCNVIKPSNTKIAKLKKGEGHLISTLDKQKNDIHSSLFYNKSLVESIIEEDEK